VNAIRTLTLAAVAGIAWHPLAWANDSEQQLARQLANPSRR
jgi:hypothetical protein